MTLGISREEVLQFLHAIEIGEVTLTPQHEPQGVYAGVVVCDASNGWEIAVFNDANEWDYIEWITSSNGRHVSFDDLDQHAREIANYIPTEDLAWLRYGIPGYMKFRCTRCGVVFEYGKDRVYRCNRCRSGENA